MNYLELAAQLRNSRQAEQQQRAQQFQQGGAASGGGGQVGSSMFQTGGYQQQPQNNPQANPLQQGVDAYKQYNNLNKAFGSGAGAFSGATPATMGAMSAGGGSSLGSMGLMSSAPAVSFPGAATAAPSAAGGSTGAFAGAGPVGWLALGAKALNDTGVSSYGNTAKGQWAGNITDKVFGDRDKSGMTGNMLGAIGNFFGGDFGGAFDRGKSAVKDLFKLDFF